MSTLISSATDGSSVISTTSSLSEFGGRLLEARRKWLFKRVWVDDEAGLVRYVGPVVTSKKASTLWLGIEWDRDTRGKHDGGITTHSGATVRYFTCKAGCGSFIKPVKASLGRDVLTVTRERFSLADMREGIAQQRDFEAETAYKIQFVGWEKSSAQLCDLSSKTVLVLDASDVSHIDADKVEELGTTLPICERIDMTACLVSDWQSLRHFSALPHLRELTLNRNALSARYFTSQTAFDSFKGAFPNLTQLTLNKAVSVPESALNWSTTWFVVFNLARSGALPKLEVLEIADDNIEHFDLPTDAFECLTALYTAFPDSFVPKPTPKTADASADSDTDEKKGTEDEIPAADSSTVIASDSGSLQPGHSTLLVPCHGDLVASIFGSLKTLNIGGNTLSEWSHISSTFGNVSTLTKLECNYSKLTSMRYLSGEFANLRVIKVQSNQFTEVQMLDAMHMFPSLCEVAIHNNPIGAKLGASVLRDLCIAKVRGCVKCNGSEVGKLERTDAELFYLKWINEQVAKDTVLARLSEEAAAEEDSDSKKKKKKTAATESSVEEMRSEASAGDGTSVILEESAKQRFADAMEAKFVRYKELVKVYGVQKRKKRREGNFDTCSVSIKSMDPESITAAPLQKLLPRSMTVGQLKMLCKRAFKLEPRFQRLMLKSGMDFPSDMAEDCQPLSFYGVKDGATILMQSQDFSKK